MEYNSYILDAEWWESVGVRIDGLKVAAIK